MSYRNYVITAYAVFAIVLLWDLLVPWLQLRREFRTVKMRAARQSSARTPLPETQL